jgi:hypothetical protein
MLVCEAVTHQRLLYICLSRARWSATGLRVTIKTWFMRNFQVGLRSFFSNPSDSTVIPEATPRAAAMLLF